MCTRIFLSEMIGTQGAVLSIAHVGNFVDFVVRKASPGFLVVKSRAFLRGGSFVMQTRFVFLSYVPLRGDTVGVLDIRAIGMVWGGHVSWVEVGPKEGNQQNAAHTMVQR